MGFYGFKTIENTVENVGNSFWDLVDKCYVEACDEIRQGITADYSIFNELKNSEDESFWKSVSAFNMAQNFNRFDNLTDINVLSKNHEIGSCNIILSSWNKESEKSKINPKRGRPKKYYKIEELKAAHRNRNSKDRTKRKKREFNEELRQNEIKKLNESLKKEYSKFIKENKILIKKYCETLFSLPDSNFIWNEPGEIEAYHDEIKNLKNIYQSKIISLKNHEFANPCQKSREKKKIINEKAKKSSEILENMNKNFRTWINELDSKNKNLKSIVMKYSKTTPPKTCPLFINQKMADSSLPEMELISFKASIPVTEKGFLHSLEYYDNQEEFHTGPINSTTLSVPIMKHCKLL